MAAVVDAIADYADEHASALQEAAGLAKGLRRKLHKWGVWRHAAAIGAAAAGAGPEETAAAAAAVEVAGGAGMEDDEPVRAFETVAHFHDEFEELIACLGVDLQAVVVFIDDMDRCSNAETIVETFEAMRLFLHAPTTAYVVGAHEDIVEAALDRRYEGRLAGDEDLGSHWLEKMLQHPIKVPPLGGPEVMSYINLLFAEIHTSSEHFGELRAKADEPQDQPVPGRDERRHRSGHHRGAFRRAFRGPRHRCRGRSAPRTEPPREPARNEADS